MRRQDVPRLWALAGSKSAGHKADPSLGVRRWPGSRGRTGKSWRARRELHLAIEMAGSRKLAGVVSVLDIDWTERDAEAGTWIGPRYRGRGINQEAKRLLLDFAFAELGLVRLRFLTRADNPRAKRALEKLGATPEGTIRRGAAGERDRHDLVLFSIWRDDD